MDEKTIARFWNKVEKSDGCWLWKAGAMNTGYGSFCIGARRNRLAHRVSWFLTHGSWPTLCVLHRCDVRRCVNPDHLFLGTRTENSADMATKLRSVNKLTPEQVTEIRRRAAVGIPKSWIADDFGVTRTTVYDIAIGKTWRWLHCSAYPPILEK